MYDMLNQFDTKTYGSSLVLVKTITKGRDSKGKIDFLQQFSKTQRIIVKLLELRFYIKKSKIY